MADITIAPVLDNTLSTAAHIIYTDAATGTFKKAPLSAVPIAWGNIVGTLSNQIDLDNALDAKQATLVSGTNIKTINGSSILGSGNLTISGGSTPTEQTLTDGATITWDLDNGTYANVTLGGNRTLVLANEDAPISGVLQVTQDGTGSRTLSLPGHVPSGLALSTGGGDVDILKFDSLADGVFWSIENYGSIAAPTPLNAPTSFAAGTPTADGCPFTWTDTNSSPAESSYLIQITTAADTTYASVVATRTPAADATSAVAGTGLSASTAYRARIKAVGNGTTTSDSAYSSDVTFTTDAAASLSFLTVTSASGGTVTESPTGTWSVAAGAYAICNEQITGDGVMQAEVGASANEIVIIGFDEDATLQYHNTGGATPTLWKWFLALAGGTYQCTDGTTEAAVDTTIAYATGDLYQLRVTGTTVIAEKSSNGGSTWTTLHTFPTARTTSGTTIYRKFDAVTTGSAVTLKNLKG